MRDRWLVLFKWINLRFLSNTSKVSLPQPVDSLAERDSGVLLSAQTITSETISTTTTTQITKVCSLLQQSHSLSIHTSAVMSHHFTVTDLPFQSLVPVVVTLHSFKFNVEHCCFLFCVVSFYDIRVLWVWVQPEVSCSEKSSLKVWVILTLLISWIFTHNSLSRFLLRLRQQLKPPDCLGLTEGLKLFR